MDKLEFLKSELNRMIASGNYDKDELIKKSEELDKYIVQAMKEKLSCNDNFSK